MNNIKNSIFTILLFVLTSVYHAQSEQAPNWSVVADDTYKMGIMMATDAAGNAVMVGDRSSFMGNAYIFTRKFDVLGNLLWEKMDSTSIPWNWHKPGWVCTDNENNIYIAGFRYSGTSNFYTTQIIALKYNFAGELIWKRVIDHNWPSLLPMRACLDSDNNFYIGTVGLSPGFTLIKLDNEGNVVFNVANASTNNQSFNSMRIKNDLIVMTSYGANGTILSVVAFNTNGDFLWGHILDSHGGMDVEIDDDMNIYLLSRKLNQVSASSNFDIKIFKLNMDGDAIDEFNYDFGSSTDFVSRMTLVNGKISIIGQSILVGSGYMNWLILQTDLDGNMLWATQYDYMASNDEAPYWITARENGDVYVSGKGGPAYVDFNGSEYLRYVTTKYSNGELQWRDTNPYQGYTGIVNSLDNDCGIYVLGETGMTVNHYTDECGVINVESDPRINSTALNIYPNPASDDITVICNVEYDPNAQIMIYNSVGKIVEKLHHQTLHRGINEIQISVSDWEVGVYLVTVQSKTGVQSKLFAKNQ